MVLGLLFVHKQLVMLKKKEKFHAYGNRENAHFHVEAARGKREKWRKNHLFVVTLAVRVLLNLSFDEAPKMENKGMNALVHLKITRTENVS